MPNTEANAVLATDRVRSLVRATTLPRDAHRPSSFLRDTVLDVGELFRGGLPAGRIGERQPVQLFEGQAIRRIVWQRWFEFELFGHENSPGKEQEKKSTAKGAIDEREHPPRLVDPTGLEPATSCVQSRRSTR